MIHNKTETIPEITPEITNTYIETNSSMISYIPPEIHLELCRHLDSISTKNLRLTSRTIRESIGTGTIKKKIQSEIKPVIGFLENFGLSLCEEPILGNDYLYRSLRYNTKDIDQLNSDLAKILTDKLATYHLRKKSPFFNQAYKEYTNDDKLPAKEEWHNIVNEHGITWIANFTTNLIMSYAMLHGESAIPDEEIKPINKGVFK